VKLSLPYILLNI